METVINLVISFLGFNGGVDKYVSIGTTPTPDEKNVIPFACTDVPDLGSDHQALVKQVEQLYNDDALRRKWLMAIHRLRTTNTGWIMDKSNKSRPFTKWGLTPISR